MQHSGLQLTIRGIDLPTKRQLTKLAARRGVSLNSLVVSALQQTAGTNPANDRLERIKQTLQRHRISSQDLSEAEAAIAKMDQVSKVKQRRDERDLSV